MGWVRRCAVVMLAAVMGWTGSAAPAAWAQAVEKPDIALEVTAPPAAPTNGDQPAQAGPSAGAHVAAGFTNVAYVPGKAVTCAVSGVLGVATVLVTFGARYDAGATLTHGGCSGKWVLRGQDIHQAIHPGSASNR